MKPISELEAEHDSILKILDVLEEITERVVSGREVPVEHIKEVLNFLQLFADRLHHGKEEGILFPALKKAGVAVEGGPIGVMLSEHDRGREFIAEMKKLLASYEQGSSDALIVFTTPALQYMNLLRSHIWKENNVLFRVAGEAIPREQLESMEREFEDFEKEAAGADAKALRETAERLSGIYLSKKG